MREIKFRAYIPHGHWINEEEKGFYIVDNWQDTIYPESLGFNPYEDGIFIVQFTGLKDKNGVEIFEGDIIKNIKGDVSFIIFALGRFNTNSYYGGGVDWYNQINKIIGNIHQNKDLLK